MVAIRRFNVTTGESHFTTPPVPDEHQPELEEEAASHSRCEECNGLVFFVVHLPVDD